MLQHLRKKSDIKLSCEQCRKNGRVYLSLHERTVQIQFLCFVRCLLHKRLRNVNSDTISSFNAIGNRIYSVVTSQIKQTGALLCERLQFTQYCPISCSSSSVLVD